MTTGARRAQRDPDAAARQAEVRREQARAQFEAACDELRSSEGWQRFAKARALLRGYSLNNTMLILAQRPEATTVASYRRWLELGRQVRRGERSLRIWAPSVRRERDESTGEETTSVRAFVLVPVFDVSQTEGPPLPEPPPVAPMTGDSHAQLLPGLEWEASEAGYAVERRREMPGHVQGFVDDERWLIALSRALPRAVAGGRIPDRRGQQRRRPPLHALAALSHRRGLPDRARRPGAGRDQVPPPPGQGDPGRRVVCPCPG